MAGGLIIDVIGKGSPAKAKAEVPDEEEMPGSVDGELAAPEPAGDPEALIASIEAQLEQLRSALGGL